MPSSYSDFTGGFAMFNLQMAPPGGAKEAMKFGWAEPTRRVLTSLSEDDTEATRVFRGHLFYSFLMCAVVPALHIAFVALVEFWLKKELPEPLQPPLVIHHCTTDL